MARLGDGECVGSTAAIFGPPDDQTRDAMAILSALQGSNGRGGTATAVDIYSDWASIHIGADRLEIHLDEQSRGSLRDVARWRPGSGGIPRFMPAFQVPPYVAARHAVKQHVQTPEEIHVIGASAIHGAITQLSSPTLVWFATTVADERRPEVLRGRPWTRQVAYRATQPLLTRLERSVLSTAKRVLAMSTHTADLVVATGVPASRVEVLLVPVDTDGLRPPEDNAVRRGALFVGRAHDPRKGFDRLLDTFRSSPSLGDRGLTVVSAGAPILNAPNLRWQEPVQNLASFYRSAEVLLLPSRQEGLGIVALEAMACATPVIARRCGGIDRVLRESGGGVVTSSPKGFCAAVEQLLGDPAAAQEIGKAGRKWVEQHASRRAFMDDGDLFRL